MQRTGRRKRTVRKFLKRMQKKLIFIFLTITLMLVALIGRLMYIEYESGDRYEKIVLSQQGYDSRSIPYQRGDIVDAKGTVLATSLDVYNVIFDCNVLNQKEQEEIDATVEAIAACFEDVDADDLYQRLKEHPKSQYETLLKKLPYEKIQPYTELLQKQEEENKEKKSGQKTKINKNAVWFEKEYIRNYPYGSLASSLIGFVSGGNVGTTGLENTYNSVLNGINGREYGYLNSDNNFEKTVKAAKDGNTIVSTIDASIQSVVEKKIAEYNEKNTNGFVTGDGCDHIAAIVMNPQNGEVYAMANNPGFDLNQPREISNYFTEEELAGLSDEEKMDLLNKLWENFCITYTFEPGSTVKPMTVACGLETGTLSGNETYVCDGVETISGEEVHCVNRSGHGTETVEASLMDSCNDALMQMSYSIGKDHFVDYQEIFGFGRKTGIDLPGEERGLLFSREKMQKLDLATNSFGQNFNCTMIQVAAAFSSLINGGRYYRPHVVKKILDSEGNTIETIRPTLIRETTSEETSELIRQWLYATVSEGTGGEAKVNGYSMGGKTGTAQKLPRAEKNYLVSFIGYLPQENPQLVIYLIIDHPNVKEQAHSNYAQTVVKEILEEILPYMNLYPDEALQPEPEEDGEDGLGEGAEGGPDEGTPAEGEGASGEGAPEGAEGGPGEGEMEGAEGSPGEGTPVGEDEDEPPADFFEE